MVCSSTQMPIRSTQSKAALRKDKATKNEAQRNEMAKKRFELSRAYDDHAMEMTGSGCKPQLSLLDFVCGSTDIPSAMSGEG